MRFRVHWRLLGSHVHAKLYAGKPEQTPGLAGEVCFRPAEWEVFQRTVAASAYRRDWEFIEETVAEQPQSAALQRFNERRARGIPIGGPDERRKRKQL